MKIQIMGIKIYVTTTHYVMREAVISDASVR